MKRILSALMVLCLLAGTTLTAAESPHFEGKPWINTAFYGLWPAERPAVEDNFELYANFDTYQAALAKGDRRFYTPIAEAQLLADQQAGSLCTDPDLTGTEAECMRILYGLYQDTLQAQDAIAPLRLYVERLRAVKSLEELTALIREDGWMYGKAFFTGDLNITDRELGKYYIIISKAEIPDYVVDEETFDVVGRDVETAKQHLMRMGWSEEEAPQAVDLIVAYLDEIGEWNLFPSTEEERELDSRAASQLLSADDIREYAAPLYELLKARGLVKEGTEAEPVYRCSFRDLKKFNLFWQEENLETIKGILALAMYDAAEKILSQDTAEDETMAPAVRLVYMAPQAVREQGFVHNFVSQERVDLYKELAEKYKDALRARIERNDWASEGTKQEIYRKIDQLVAAEILYPYGEIDCSPLLEKLRACGHFTEAYGWCSWFNNQCVAHFAGLDYAAGNRFGMSAGRIGTLQSEGRYLPEDNAFYVGGASLCDITLVMTSPETILGTFGAHISHEFCHAFDTACVNYNADFTGPLFATEEDREIFEQKAAAIIKQVSSIEVFDGYYSDGNRQSGEILADLTGMSLTLDMAKEIENFDYDAYFRAFAYFFCSYLASREDAVPESAGDIHPYTYLRINFTVQHFEEFYQTYPSVKEGTPMYLTPEERLLIW